MKEHETDISFESRAQYVDWRTANQSLFDPVFSTDFSESILSKGFVEPLSGRSVAPSEIKKGSNLREGIVYDGVNSRMRAVLFAINNLTLSDRSHKSVYAAESVTGMARRLRNAFPRFTGSEFISDVAKRDGQVRHEDLTALSFPDGLFDIVTTNEVLEHVPDIDAALREIARVLKSGGWHIGTCPFTNLEDSIVRSKLVNGKIVHLLPPEYHGDPVTGASNSLVFEIPGWNILQRAKAAGFSSAFIRLIASKRHGVIASDGFISVMCFQR